jgi:hypothetical protein
MRAAGVGREQAVAILELAGEGLLNIDFIDLTN